MWTFKKTILTLQHFMVIMLKLHLLSPQETIGNHLIPPSTLTGRNLHCIQASAAPVAARIQLRC